MFHRLKALPIDEFQFHRSILDKSCEVFSPRFVCKHSLYVLIMVPGQNVGSLEWPHSFLLPESVACISIFETQAMSVKYLFHNGICLYLTTVPSLKIVGYLTADLISGYPSMNRG